jgi:predicted acyl esterase
VAVSRTYPSGSSSARLCSVNTEKLRDDAGSNDHAGDGQQEDVAAMLERYPLMHEYWEDKRARIDRIKVPAYILASFSTMVHTEGSFRGFEDIAHSEKW